MLKKILFIWSFSIALILLLLTFLFLEFGWATQNSMAYFMSLLGALFADIFFGNRAAVVKLGKNLSEIWYFYFGLFFNYTIPAVVLVLSRQPVNSLFGQILIFSVLAINGLVILYVLYKRSRNGSAEVD